MIQEIGLEQGSPEWLRLRRTGPLANPYGVGLGCSDLSVLAGVSPYATLADLWKEKGLGIVRKATEQEEWLRERGHRRERVLRAEYNARTGRKVRPAVLYSERMPWLVASLDGWEGEGRPVLEIKCAAMEYVRLVEEWIVPDHWQPQIMGQLAVTGAPFVHLVVEPFVGGPTRTMTAEWGDVTRFPGAGELLSLAEAFVKAVRAGCPQPQGFPFGWIKIADETGTGWTWKQVLKEGGD